MRSIRILCHSRLGPVLGNSFGPVPGKLPLVASVLGIGFGVLVAFGVGFAAIFALPLLPADLLVVEAAVGPTSVIPAPLGL